MFCLWWYGFAVVVVVQGWGVGSGDYSSSELVVMGCGYKAMMALYMVW